MSAEPTPLEPDQLDELLSAALDGELDAAARELGLNADEAQARIRATPGAQARRAALESARALLAETPELDELLATRLRAKAVRAADAQHVAHALERKRRRNRIALSTCGIAAAIAAVVAVAAGINGFHPDSYSSSSKSASGPTSIDNRDQVVAPAPATASGTSGVADLGSFADAHALARAAVDKDAVARARAEDHRLKSVLPTFGTINGQAATAVPTTVRDGAQKSSTDSTTTGVNSPTARAQEKSVPDQGLQYDSVANAAATCTAPPQVPTGATPVLRASATLAGQPVVVLVFSTPTEHIVVIEDANCKLVNVQMLD
jgi:hypothetical protein